MASWHDYPLMSQETHDHVVGHWMHENVLGRVFVRDGQEFPCWWLGSDEVALELQQFCEYNVGIPTWLLYEEAL